MALVQITASNATAGNAILASDHASSFANWNEVYASRRLATASQSSNQTLNQTALGSASDIFASDLTFTADGTSAYRIEFFAASVECASTGFTQIHLVDGSGNDIVQLAQVHSSNGVNRVPVNAIYYWTPTSGSKSVNVRGIYATAGNGVIYSGGSGFAPIRMSIFGPDLT